MGNYLDILIVGFSVFGGLFGLLGSYGLIKLNDPVSRLHAPTMTSTLGVGAILLASFFHSWAYDNQGSSHELLILIFLLLTAPVTAKFIAKVHISRRTNPDDLPRPGDDRVWASHMNCDESGVPPQQQG